MLTAKKQKEQKETPKFSKPGKKRKGGNRCIAPACTSGYDSNSKSVHVFLVPKGKEKDWQKAIHRDDIIVKAGQKVCELHFAEEDILWGRELKSKDGQILGTVRIFFIFLITLRVIFLLRKVF